MTGESAASTNQCKVITVSKDLSRHRDLYAGLWRYGEIWGYTSRGAGLADPPARFNCQGEVTEFRLRAA